MGPLLILGVSLGHVGSFPRVFETPNKDLGKHYDMVRNVLDKNTSTFLRDSSGFPSVSLNVYLYLITFHGCRTPEPVSCLLFSS